jgi:hypothetical protein
MRKPSKIKFNEIDDYYDGKLLVIENEIPFKIKRIYFIDDLRPVSLRGFHAHKELNQVIFCIRGSFELELYNGKKSQKIKVGKEGILIPHRVWHMMRKFTNDCLICVLASDIYKESDYIRNFHEFKKLIK